jgi:hypothetical protein
VLLALSLLALSLSVVWFAVVSSRQQAVEQASRQQYATPEVRAEDFPLVFSEPSPEFAGVTSPDGRPRVIPGLSEMSIVGNLQHIPGTSFRCPGGSPDQGLHRRVCRSSSGEDPAVYEVTVESDQGVVVWVQATARDALDEEAARVLGYVATLAVGDAGPLVPQTWVDRTISSGGQYLAEGAEVRLYGTEGARTLEIIGTALPAGELRREDTRLKTDQAKDKGSTKANQSKEDTKAKAKDKG